jgi:predicted DNA binding protein
MSITAKLHIEHERLALVPTLQRLEDVTIQVVPQGTTDPGSSTFPFLVTYHDRAALERAFDEDPTVADYEPVEWTDGQGVYYIEHTPVTKLISRTVTEVNGFLVHTETKGNGWLVRLLLPDREALNAVWNFADENDINLTIIEVYGNEDAGGGQSYGLTEEQRDTLRITYREGYFNEPRDVSLQEVAEELDLSSTAVSGRLRRGMRNLIAATILADEVE